MVLAAAIASIVMVLGLLVGVAGVWVAGHGYAHGPRHAPLLDRGRDLDRAREVKGFSKKISAFFRRIADQAVEQGCFLTLGLR